MNPAISGLILFAAVLSGAAGADVLPPSLHDAWDKVAGLNPNEALALFDKAYAQAGPGTAERGEAALGAGVALLDVQPKTAGNIARARALFQQVASAGSDGEAGIEARYFLARIDELHRDPPDPAAAERTYRALIHDHPESPVAQLAAGKLAILVLYVTSPSDQVPARFAELEEIGSRLTDPVAAAAFHLAMGMAAIDLRLPDQKAFDHLAEADRLGIPSTSARADNLVRLGSLAVSLGHPDLAARYWGQFVRDDVHDNRNYLVRQRLADLGKGAR